MIESKKTLSFAGWRDKINQRCSALDRRLIVRDQKNIIPFEIHFPKEGYMTNTYRRFFKCLRIEQKFSRATQSIANLGPKSEIAIATKFEFNAFFYQSIS